MEKLIPEETRQYLKQRFDEEMKRRVKLEVFTRDGVNEEFNLLTERFTSELSEVTDMIEVEFYTIPSEKAEERGVERSPTVLIDPDRYKIRFTGAPAGEEGRSFIQTIIDVSRDDSSLQPETREALKNLKEKKHLMVFVTPTCPYCPMAVVLAHRFAIERPDLISSEYVECIQNPDLCDRYHVGSVPQQVVNGVVASIGLQQEGDFLNQVLGTKGVPEVEGKEGGTWDVIIIGAGPAGLTAGIYAVRSGLKTVILEKESIGGLAATNPIVQNYTGFKEIPGPQLADLMKVHALSYVPIREGEVVMDVERDGEGFTVRTSKRTYKGKALILATGTTHRKLGVPGEEELYGRGVSYCATCDGHMYSGKRVVEVGGGNTAVVEALYLKSIGADVSLVHRRDTLRAEAYYQEDLEKEGIKIYYSHVVERIVGDEKVKGVVLKDLKSGRTFEVPVEGVFIAIGEDPQNEVARMLGAELDEEGYVVVDRRQRTTVPGVYAAGDITGGVKQIATAVGEGAVAAVTAFEDLKKPYYVREKLAKEATR